MKYLTVMFMLLVIPLNLIGDRKTRTGSSGYLLPVTKFPDATFVRPPVSVMEVKPPEQLLVPEEAYLAEYPDDQGQPLIQELGIVPEPVKLRDQKRKKSR